MSLLSLSDISKNLLENFKSYNLSLNEKSVKFQKLWLSQNEVFYMLPHRLNPSIVATRQVNCYRFYHYFDQQSSLKSSINKHN